MPLKLAIFVSGRGSNMGAILDAINGGRLDAEVEVVVSNNPQAPALNLAEMAGVRTLVVSHKGLEREEHERLILEGLGAYSPDFIVLAGYMRVLSPYFLKAFRASGKDADGGDYFRVINIHPSLLPAFPGAHAYEDAYAYGVKLAGITVHLVDEKVDHGPILAQETFPRLDRDSLESFKERGLALEHILLPEVLQSIACEGVHFFRRQSSSENSTEGKALKKEGAKGAS